MEVAKLSSSAERLVTGGTMLPAPATCAIIRYANVACDCDTRFVMLRAAATSATDVTAFSILLGHFLWKYVLVVEALIQDFICIYNSDINSCRNVDAIASLSPALKTPKSSKNCLYFWI